MGTWIVLQCFTAKLQRYGSTRRPYSRTFLLAFKPALPEIKLSFPSTDSKIAMIILKYVQLPTMTALYLAHFPAILHGSLLYRSAACGSLLDDHWSILYRPSRQFYSRLRFCDQVSLYSNQPGEDYAKEEYCACCCIASSCGHPCNYHCF